MMTRAIEFVYTNWLGYTRIRKAVPGYTRFMATEHHPEAQWIMHAYDPEKRNQRSFALRDCDFTEAGIAAFKLAAQDGKVLEHTGQTRTGRWSGSAGAPSDQVRRVRPHVAPTHSGDAPPPDEQADSAPPRSSLPWDKRGWTPK
jgi:hypothetical protein